MGNRARPNTATAIAVAAASALLGLGAVYVTLGRPDNVVPAAPQPTAERPAVRTDGAAAAALPAGPGANPLSRGDMAAFVFKKEREALPPLVFVDGSSLFLSRLAGVTDPEQKRKIIGRTFIDVFEQEAAKLGTVDFLAQGTLYPDVIESVAIVGQSSVIKSHHNVGGLPERMRMKLVEPLRELFKDEVRAVGRQLGLDEEFVARQPFPGPGLAVRIVGEITKARLDLLRAADRIVADEIRRAGWYERLWQSFAVLLPVQSVGVMGDTRTYEYTVAIRAVESLDGFSGRHDDLLTVVVWTHRVDRQGHLVALGRHLAGHLHRLHRLPLLGAPLGLEVHRDDLVDGGQSCRRGHSSSAPQRRSSCCSCFCCS